MSEDKKVDDEEPVPTYTDPSKLKRGFIPHNLHYLDISWWVQKRCKVYRGRHP
jgi:hypothetical protein